MKPDDRLVTMNLLSEAYHGLTCLVAGLSTGTS
jgi:hypothetical protein